MKSRHLEILELLAKDRKIEVNRLAELFGVSEVTIRKDLTELEKEGTLVREHGYALLNDSDDINKRLFRFFKEKQRIVNEALKMVEDGETILVESGSSCSLFVKALAENKKNITVITNSVFISDYIRKINSDLKIVLLGGEYQKNSQAVVGPLTRENLKSFYVDKVFIGVDGYTKETGFTGNDYPRTDIAKGMIEQAKEVIILTDSSKFGKRSIAAHNTRDKKVSVVTDNKISDEFKENLIKNNINLKIV